MSDIRPSTYEEQLVHRLVHEPGYNLGQSSEENLDRAFTALRHAYDLAILILQDHDENPNAHLSGRPKLRKFDFGKASCGTCQAAWKVLEDLGFNTGTNIPFNGVGPRHEYPPFHIPGFRTVIPVAKTEPYPGKKEKNDE